MDRCGILTAGLSAGMLVGATIAVAEPDAGSGSGDASESSESTSETSDSPAGQSNPTNVSPGTTEDTDTRASETEPTTEPEPTQALEPATVPEKGSDHSDHEAAETAPTDPVASDARAEDRAADDPVTVEPTAEPKAATPDQTTPDQTTPASGTPLSVARSAVDQDAAAPVEAATLAAAAIDPAPASAPAGPSIINVLGSLAWSVFDFFTRILSGPPVVPAGSGLKVGRTDLEIDCGDGYTAQADWYFPEDGTADKLIYFQHGFAATAGLYNITAAELAERNNAIVVAPSITSNFFACDACNLGADPMHAAVAALFTGDRVALTESARAAAEQAGVEFEGLPDEFVIAGHSGGGQLAAGTAGYFHEFAPVSEKSRLVGVLLLDTSATGGALARALDKLPTTLPVLHISAHPAPLNTYGNANEALEAARPGQFNGVRLVGGSHSDGFRSSAVFGLAQVIVSLGTGASTPENVEAVQVLAQGWITDMYAGTVYDETATRAGIYGPLNQVIDVPTPGIGTGVAHAHVLPVPPAQLNPIDRFVKSLLESLNATQALATCAEDPGAVFARQNGDAPENSTANTPLSLDGERQTGQSVGQHACTV